MKTQSVDFYLGSVFSELTLGTPGPGVSDRGVQKTETKPFYNGSLRILHTSAHVISVYCFRPLKSCEKKLQAKYQSELSVFCWLYVIDKVTAEPESVNIRTEFLPLKPAVSGGSDPGENHEALYFKDEGHILHIGTEEGAADETANGFITNIPSLKVGERICFHYLAAEQNDGNEFNANSSFAVDLPQEWLLEELGIPSIGMPPSLRSIVTMKSLFFIILLFLVISLALPFGLIESAKMFLSKDPCWGMRDQSDEPPQSGFFKAQQLLRISSYFSFLKKRAIDLAVASAVQCQGNYLQSCYRLKYEGEDAAIKKARADCDEHHLPISPCRKREDESRENWQNDVDPVRNSEFCTKWKDFLKWLSKNNAADSIEPCRICK